MCSAEEENWRSTGLQSYFFFYCCINSSFLLLRLIVVGEIVFLRHSVATSGLFSTELKMQELWPARQQCVTVYSLTALALSIKPSTSRPSDGINDSKSD